MGKPFALLFLSIVASASMAACGREPQSQSLTAADNPAAEVAVSTAAAPASAATTEPSTLPAVLVYKTPTCGCCELWVDHLREAGFSVEIRDQVDLNPIKLKVGIPPAKGSCHTAEVGGYFVEGHVPADDIKRLLSEKPDAKGLVVPGMPMGSPGMEVADGRTQPYTVELVERDGSTTAFARH